MRSNFARYLRKWIKGRIAQAEQYMFELDKDYLDKPNGTNRMERYQAKVVVSYLRWEKQNLNEIEGR